jgi:hypothetical protein
MNRLTYHSLLFFVCFVFTANIQAQNTYQRTFTVNQNTKLYFSTDNIDVTFKLWDKDEVKVDFSMDFKNYSKEEIRDISKKVQIEATSKESFNEGKLLQIKSYSEKSIARLSYEIKDGHFYITDFDMGSNKAQKHKTLAEVKASLQKKKRGFKDFNGYVVFKNDSIAVKNLETTNHKGIKSIRSSYVVYLPAYMELNFTSNRANVTFEGEFGGKISGAFQDSQLNAKAFTNPENNITFLNGDVRIGYISSGIYTFRNVTKGIIAQLNNAKIATEFSKFEIGEIVQKVDFIDFKSDITIYNFQKDFDTVRMQAEYSDIKVFFDKDHKFFMEAIGHNAVIKDGEMKFGLQPNREGKKYKMFSRGDKTKASDTFRLDLVHGFITLDYIN